MRKLVNRIKLAGYEILVRLSVMDDSVIAAIAEELLLLLG